MVSIHRTEILLILNNDTAVVCIQLDLKNKKIKIREDPVLKP